MGLTRVYDLMPTAEIFEGQIAIEAEYYEHAGLQEVPGVRYVYKAQRWLAPLAWSTCLALRGVFGENLKVGEDLNEWGRWERNRIAQITETKTTKQFTFEGLYEFQNIGTGWLNKAQYAILGDEQGLGKTVQALSASDYPVLIICTNSMKDKWKKEWEKWCPGMGVQIIQGTAAQRRNQFRAIIDAWNNDQNATPTVLVRPEVSVGRATTDNGRPVIKTESTADEEHTELRTLKLHESETEHNFGAQMGELGGNTASEKSLGSQRTTTTDSLQNKQASVESARIPPRKSDSQLTTTTTQEESEACFALPATTPSATLNEKNGVNPQKPISVVIINYESVRLHSKLAKYGSIALSEADRTLKELNQVPWACVIVDEAHRLANPKAQQTRAVWAVAHSDSVVKRFALTGTPIRKSPLDAWSILHFISPDEWPSRGQYRKRFVLEGLDFMGYPTILGFNPATEDEFHQLFDHRFLRRTKEEVLPDLPPIIRTVRHIPMEAKQERTYRAIEKDMLAQLESGALVVTNPLTQTIRLRQAASATLDIEGDKVELRTPSNKVAALLDLLEERAGRPTVVFAEYKGLIDCVANAMQASGLSFGRITGDESPAQRAETVDRFQRGSFSALLCTLGAGSEGITLTAADCMVFLQRSWSAVQNSQAEARFHRIGQEADSVEIIDFVSKDTIESRVLDRYGQNLDLLEQVCRDKVRMTELLRDL